MDRKGAKIDEIGTGALQTTCAAFVGDDLSSLAITTAREGMSDDDLVRYPQSGQTLLAEIGCRGQLDPPVLVG